MRALLVVLICVAVTASAQDVRVTRPLTTGNVPSTPVAGLPACSASNNGEIRIVTNALAPTVLGVVAGGGAVVTLVHCNGTSWVAG